MLDWRQFLRNRAPRSDLKATFHPDHVEGHEPALVNSMPMLTAVGVAARLLHVVALRGGTRVKPSALEGLLDVIEGALPPEVLNHCEDEVARVLDWLEHPVSADQIDERPEIPELAIMHGADVQNRVDVAEYAISEGFDVEFEFFDEERGVWPRIRAAPIAVVRPDGGPPILELEDEEGRLEIAIDNIRWLMPVQHIEPTTMDEDRGAKILDFPGGTEDTE